MSVKNIQTKIEEIRNQTVQYGNTRAKVADLLTLLNTEKLDRDGVIAVVAEITNLAPEFFEYLQTGNFTVDATGFGLPAELTNTPPNSPTVSIHQAFTAGTYTNWKDATNTPITLTEGDVGLSNVFFFVKDGVVEYVQKTPREAATYPLAPTDATPTKAGWYKPTVSGTYANAGGLVVQDGYYTLFYFDGTTWSKTEVQMPQASQNIANYTDMILPISAEEQFIYNYALYKLNPSTTLNIGETPDSNPEKVTLIQKPVSKFDFVEGNLLLPEENLLSGSKADTIDIYHWDEEDDATLTTNATSVLMAIPAASYGRIFIGREYLLAPNSKYNVYFEARMDAGPPQDLAVGFYASGITNTYNTKVYVSDEWQSFVAVLDNNTVTARQFSFFQIPALSMGGTFEIKNIVLTEKELPSLLVPPVNGIVQNGKNIKVLSAIIRPNFPAGAVGGEEITWTLLDGLGDAHAAELVTSVDSSSLGNSLRINFAPCKNVMSFMVNSDETFAENTMTVGASVAVDNASMHCYTIANAIFETSWNATAVKLNGVASNVIGNVIEVDVADFAIASGADKNTLRSDISLNYAGSQPWICRPYNVGEIAGKKRFKIYSLVNGSEINPATITNGDPFSMSGGVARQIVPLSVVSINAVIREMQKNIFKSGSNFWISGMMEY